MKERPILFSGEMVRAILDGGKTQTRRIVKQQPTPDELAEGVRFTESGWLLYGREFRGHTIRCPFGQPGDRLWVRETWAPIPGGPATPENGVIYRADEHAEKWLWRPSIHMPRWASRITLEIVTVRVERLWSISRGDAIAEGCPRRRDTGGTSPVVWFSELWESINGQASWSINPWVWVIEFPRWEVK
jgi:hypothetical protein